MSNDRRGRVHDGGARGVRAVATAATEPRARPWGLFAAAWMGLAALGGCNRPATDAEPPTSASAAASATVSSPAPVASAPPQPPQPPPPPAPPWVVLADEGPFDIIDLHVDTPWKVHFKGRKIELTEGHATPAMLQRGSYAGIIYPIYIPDYADHNDPQIPTATAIFDTIDKLVAAHPQVLAPAVVNRSVSPVADDHVAVFVTIEGAGAFAADITRIDELIRRGVRLVGPVHAHDNKLAGSATGKNEYGLTELGKAFCVRVYEAGALVDVSHMSDKTFADLVPIAAKFNAPIVATHSNARALRNHPRNLTDEQLQKISATGGLAGLNLHKGFVAAKKASMRDVVAQVMHMVKVAGPDHVGIGTDYDGGNPVSALGDAGTMQDLAKQLLEAGLSAGDVRKIFGANALRVLGWGLVKP